MGWLWHHFTYAWAWSTWIGNITADIIVTATLMLFWPILRKKLDHWLDHKLQEHHHGIISQFEERLHKLVETEEEREL